MVKDYALQIKVRNAPLLRAMRARGHETAASLARAACVSQTIIGRYLSLQYAPYCANRLRPSAERLAIALQTPVEALFPPQHLHAPLRKSTAEIEVSLDEIAGIASSVDVDMERLVGQKQIIHKLLPCLTAHQREIINRRYGLDGCGSETLDEIAANMEVTRERVRQIEMKACRKMALAAKQLRIMP